MKNKQFWCEKCLFCSNFIGSKNGEVICTIIFTRNCFGDAAAHTVNSDCYYQPGDGDGLVLAPGESVTLEFNIKGNEDSENFWEDLDTLSKQ